MIYLRKFQYFP